VCKKIFFEHAVQTFAASLPHFGVSFFRLIVRVFAALWGVLSPLMAQVLPTYVKFLKCSTKVCCIFLCLSAAGCP